jgi:hypothetical protein
MQVRTFLKMALAAGLIVLGTSWHPSVAADEATRQAAEPAGRHAVNKDNPPAASHQERDHTPSDRDFVQQPPLIPHTTSGYQITKNFNKCMDCHGWARRQVIGRHQGGRDALPQPRGAGTGQRQPAALLLHPVPRAADRRPAAGGEHLPARTRIAMTHPRCAFGASPST